jgi:ABC-type transporter Mla subunit MlaD
MIFRQVLLWIAMDMSGKICLRSAQVSEDYTQGQPFNAGQTFGTQGASTELQSILDRVKDERLRLLRLLKDCETRFGSMGVVPPAEEIAKLTGKVRAIDDAVRNRYTQLRHDETLLDKRAYQIDQLRECVQGLADQINSQIEQVNSQVEQARAIKPDLVAAKQAVKAAMDVIVQDARTQLSQLGDNVGGQLGDFRNAQASGIEQLGEARREIENVFTGIDDRLAAAAGLARDEAQKLIDPIFGQLENHTTECGQRIHQIIEAANNTVREKLEALPDEAQKFVEPAKETLNAVIEDARKHTASLNDTLHTLDPRLQEFNDKADNAIEQRLKALPYQVNKTFEPARDELNNVIEDARSRTDTLNEAVQELGPRLQDFTNKADDAIDQRIDKLPAQAQAALDGLVEEQLESHRDALTEHKAVLDNRLKEFDSMLAERFNKHQASLDQRDQEMTHGIDEMFARKQAELTRALDERGQALNDQQSALDKRLEEFDATLTERFSKHHLALDEHDQEITHRIDELVTRKQAELIIELDERSQTMTDQLLAKQRDLLDHEAGVLDAKRKTLREEADKASQALTDIWDSKTLQASAKAKAGADTLLVELSKRVDKALDNAGDRADEIGQQIHGQLTASLDQSHAEAIDTARKLEGESKGISEKADKLAAEAARTIERSMREHVVDTMTRADAITDPFKARLEDALENHRKLADEFSRTTEAELSEKAKVHWDAFRHDTQAALEKQKQLLESQAKATIEDTQQTMRQNVQELCTSSQSMVDLIEQQLTRKLKGIDPQAQQAFDIIEKQVGERLGQLRENSQSMVQLIEDQLAKRIDGLQPKAVSAARDAELEINEHLSRVREEVENVIVPLRRQAIEELSQISEVGKTVRGVIKGEQVPQAATEPPIVDASNLTAPLQEMASRMGKKAAKLVNAHGESKANNESVPDNTDDDRKAA